MMSKKYRPSSGTEGMHFTDKFCEQCKNADDDFAGCQISDRTMFFNIDDERYPKEWTYNSDGEPTCTEFKKGGE